MRLYAQSMSRLERNANMTAAILPFVAFIAAVVLLHAPLVIAVLVAIAWLADRERRERNFARGAPWHEAG